MSIAPLNLQLNYWENFEIQDEDLEFLYNLLLEKETPLTSRELVEVLAKERIRIETENIQRNLSAGTIYFPRDHYQAGDVLQFPAFNWAEGKVVSVRPGINPEIPPFEVIEVEFKDQTRKLFASGVENHILNNPVTGTPDDPSAAFKKVMDQFSRDLEEKLTEKFKSIPDLVNIAGAWFPRSLLVDINMGHLNLAEAVLEVAGGGPLPTRAILEQIDLPTNVNPKLTEFSLNLALQEDDRFDEVGPAGEILWFLRRLEPEDVQNPPLHLRYQPPGIKQRLPLGETVALNLLVFDELEAESDRPEPSDTITVSLIYPHWRSGTIPLSKSIARLFPTAYEAPRVNFTIVDAETEKTYSGWVVRPHRYVFGLKEWYEEKNIIPGSLFVIKRGKRPGEVLVQALKKHTTKDWVRTVLVGADGGLVFTMLKQQINTEIDDRMAIMVPNPDAIDQLWQQNNHSREPIEKSVLTIMKELMKLSPQGHVHAQELYAGVNIIRRCPPGIILQVLADQPQVSHLGDLYFRLSEPDAEG